MPVPPPSLENLCTPVAWGDAEGRVQGVNAAFAYWLGVSEKRLQQQTLEALEHQGNALSSFLNNDEHNVLHLHRFALGIPGGTPSFAEGWLTRLEAGAWLLEAQDTLQALPNALSAAFKGLAHELRNPLSGLKGAAQLLARLVKHRDQEECDLVELIGAEIERLNTLLERLLFSAPARPHAQLNIHTVLERVLPLAETEAGCSVILQRDYDLSIPNILGDADRLTQAVWNLVRNAIQAGANRIILRTRVEHGQRIRDRVNVISLRLEVIDDGDGVPEALAEHVFLPLVSSRAEGSGLGLPLAQQVAHEHHGMLTFRSQPGQTIFILSLPQMMIESDKDLHYG
ncbi:PAS domain-containing sensor histidine kinase [Xylella fastidiosa subsp. multiplex]|nr:ATP-binding protein [Xylella fastidiosa]MDD0908838.1 PAS domain-containing sensor histidine kinase [Xylella fastidiosa subsp. multiplex]